MAIHPDPMKALVLGGVAWDTVVYVDAAASVPEAVDTNGAAQDLKAGATAIVAEAPVNRD